jgi:hypothetical protein
MHGLWFAPGNLVGGIAALNNRKRMVISARRPVEDFRL